MTRLEASARALAELRGRLRHDLQLAQYGGVSPRVAAVIVRAIELVIEEEARLFEIDGPTCGGRAGHA